MLAEIGPNGERSEAVYDPLGRLIKTWLPGQPRADGQPPNVKYEYDYNVDAPTVVTTHSLRPDEGYNTSYQLHDGFLRQRQSQLPTVGGGRLITDTWYDSRGLAYKSNAVYFNNQPPAPQLHGVLDWTVPHQNITVFDALERPTAKIYKKHGEKQWRSTVSYGGDRKHVVPPEGGIPTTVIYDAQGNVVERRQYHGDTSSGAYDATSYSYTPQGKVASLTDAAGNTWSWEYDVLGRKTATNDPDRGTTTFAYNKLDQLVSTTDARGKTLAYTYDALGRKTAMFQGSAGGTKLAEWTYDTLKKGLPTASIRYVDGQRYVRKVAWYDEQNRPVTKQVIIPQAEGALAGMYTFRTSYQDNSDRVSAQTVPGVGGLPVERIYHQYNKLGLATKTYGIDTYAQEHLYSPYGETLRLTYGEGGDKAWSTNYYIEGTRRLDQTILDRNTDAGYRVSDRRYSYDPAGNITRIANVPKDAPQDVQCFDYDYLRRLTQAFTPASGDCGEQPSKAGLGGVAPYWMEFSYDKAGNRTGQTVHDAEGSLSRQYEYPGAGQPRPHALTAVVEQGPSGTARSEFTYDAAGNTLTRMIGGDTQTLTWNAEGNLARLARADGATSEYIYDASGARLLKREPGRTVLYLPDTELTLNTETGEVTGKRYYAHGGQTVAVRSSTGSVTMLFGNHQGTGTEAIAAEGDLAVSRRYFTPFGVSRGPEAAQWPTEKGFVGGTRDDAGLTRLGAREYVPATGRFLSVDPLMDLTKPRHFSGYAYAYQSPVTYSDPNGQRPIWFDRPATEKERFVLDRYRRDRSGFDATAVEAAWAVHQGQEQKARRIRQQAQTQALQQVGLSQAEYQELRKVAASKQSWFDYTVDQLPEILGDLTGFTDIKSCVSGGGIWACAQAIVGLLPWSKALKAVGSIGKIIKAVKAGLAWADKVVAARRKLSKVKALSANILGKLKRCRKNSFTAGTLVLMADGTRQPIENVQLGDTVLATDPETGETTDREVVGTIVGTGSKNLVRITIDTDGDAGHATGNVVATAGHPFWAEEQSPFIDPTELHTDITDGGEGTWVTADDLDRGDQLLSTQNERLRVVATREYTTTQTVYNLTIAGVHTYHVGTSAVDTLVHNCGGAGFPDRKLPRKKNGEPQPDAAAPHTQLGRKAGRNGEYPQAREFDANGNPVRDIDFTDHGRPAIHGNPHQHVYEANPTGGTPFRGDAAPLE